MTVENGSSAPYDAVIIGGGHNGLVCAFYLAKAGMRVGVFERRGIVGGAAVTEEFHPGFRNSSASYTVGLLNADVIHDMGLHDQGLRIVHRPISNFLPTEDGRFLKVGGGLGRTQAEFRKFSLRDAERLPAYYERLQAIADFARDMATKTPPNPRRRVSSAFAAASQLWPVVSGSSTLQGDTLDLFMRSAAAFLESWFESEPVKAVFGFDSIVGAYASPYTPGSAYVLLHHVFGETNGRKGEWGHAIGGMGAITQAMRQACEAVGVEIFTDAPVASVNVRDNAACGIVLDDGREFDAARVVSNVNPKILYERLVHASHLDAEFRQRISAWRCGSGTFRMNVALSELPNFTCLPGTDVAEHHQSGIILAPTLAYMDRAFTDAKHDGWSKKPIVEMVISSTLDDTLAPAGAHVASLFCQQFAPELPDGRSWDDEREAAADHIIETVDGFAPNFKKSVLGRSILSPLDLERTFGLIGGDIFHGALTLDQMWAARPMLGFGDYRGPLHGLYMCGAGSHPGGGVTGLPGRNAAREILIDRRFPFRRHA